MLNLPRACSTLVCTDPSKRNDISCQQAKFAQSRHACYTPPATVHHRREKSAWMKARVQSVQNRSLRKSSINNNIHMSTRPTAAIATPTSAVLSPKRKQVAFVKTQELNSILEAHVDTSHVSELRYEEDISPHIHVTGIEVATGSHALCG
jgi:hypothetical protein